MSRLDSVLVIEDQELVLGALLSLLQRGLGINHVRGTHSAEEALQLMTRQQFGLILADYHLAGMSGVSFLETLRNRGDYTPVLLLSGVPEKEAVLRATQWNQTAFLGKPFAVSDLVLAMTQLTGANHFPLGKAVPVPRDLSNTSTMRRAA